MLARDAGGRVVCGGARTLDHRHDRVEDVAAAVTMLASGGCGQVYRHTTNPSIATGDGVAMAYRAGARIANMEFIQFHPTALFPTEDPAFLISEALRGEGAVLRLLDGTAFMERYHPLASLAPRDVVARAIDHELKRRGEPHVLLDVTPIPRETLEGRFPGAVEGCRARGVDLYGSGIPVVPAAHYVCGGVLTDEEGRTNVPGLYASGEVACTGVHGANRLASNSLLEAVVFSHRAARAVLEGLGGQGGRERRPAAPPAPRIDPGGGDQAPGAREGSDAVLERRRELRTLMWELVGIVRSDARLEDAEHEVASRLAENERTWSAHPWTAESVELRNLLHVSELIVQCARMRRESRGLHFNEDHRWRDNERFLRDTVVRR
jgi:L-aspartate oxidase